jgi:hypothetical protein
MKDGRLRDVLCQPCLVGQQLGLGTAYRELHLLGGRLFRGGLVGLD